MPRRWTWYDRMSRPHSNSLHKLLGDLEVEIMEEMWRRGEHGERAEATVRDVANAIQEKRAVAYTTVMTVMTHLAEKGLLTRTPLDKKTHLYKVALTEEEFLARSSRQMVEALVEDFGDLALSQFLEVVEQADPRHLEHLRGIMEESKGQPDVAPEPEPGAESGAEAKK